MLRVSQTGKYLAGWLFVPVLAALNGALRDATYGRILSPTLAHSLAAFPVVVGIFAWALYLARRVPLAAASQAVIAGVAWATLTVAAELGLGRARGVPLSSMLAEYDVTSGHLWVLVPLACLLAPSAAWRVRRAPLSASA